MIMFILFIDQQEGNFLKLQENVNGLLLVRCGNPPPLPKAISNCFSFEKDVVIKDRTTSV